MYLHSLVLFQFGYFVFWFGSVAKLETDKYANKFLGPIQFQFDSSFLSNYGFIDKNIIWGFSLTIG